MRLAQSTAFISLALSGCLNGPAFMKQKGTANLQSTPGEAKVTTDAAVVADSDGVLTAALDPNTDAAQLISASSSSAMAGSSISFPPGSVAIATEITVEEGASLASDSVASDLGAGAGTLSAASPAMVISSSAETDATQPFTVSLVIGSSLYLDDAGKELVVVYKVKKASDGGTYIGVIPADEITLEGGKASFKASYFGSYQAVYTTVAIAKIEKATSAPIVTKREEKNEEQPLTTATEVSELKVNRKGQTFVELGWKPATVASGYVVRMQAGTTVDLNCHAGDFKDVPGRNTLVGRFDGLAANTVYSFRVCSTLEGGNDSVGKTITVTTAPNQESVVTDTFTVTASATPARIVVKVNPTPQMLSPNPMPRFRAKFVVNSSTPPADCSGGREFGGTEVESDRFPPQVNVAFRVCSIAPTPGGEILGSGVTGTKQTGVLDIRICNGGGTMAAGDTCIVAGDKIVASGAFIAGLGSVKILSAVTLHAPAPAGSPLFPQKLEIDVAGTVTLEGNAQIQANDKGFPGGSPGGFGPGGGRLASSGGTGGGSGGEGGFGSDDNRMQVGLAYGDYAFPGMWGPRDWAFGSGGAWYSGSSASAGGGAIRIRAGKLELLGSGIIMADGQDGLSSNDGGGSGGTILIEVNKLDLDASATIRANGGSGNLSGGGGGGGRVAIHCSSQVAAECLIDNPSGLMAEGGGSGSTDSEGASGTVFVRRGSGTATLNIGAPTAGRYNSRARTMFDPNTFWLSSLQIDQSHVYIAAPHTNTMATIGTMTLDGSSKVDNSGLGGQGGHGDVANPAPGEGLAPNGAGGGPGVTSGGGGGGGHAGQGGVGASGATAGTSYGSIGTATAGPLSTGSGGGGGGGSGADGGSGGGLIRLKVGTLTINSGSKIMANGTDGRFDGSAHCGGGGAGGAIWISATTINTSETPAFEARGGSGYCNVSGSKGGGGGGGFINITPGQAASACDVNAGIGSNPGANGSKQGC